MDGRNAEIQTCTWMGEMQKCRSVHESVWEECRNADLCMGGRVLFPHGLKEVGSADHGAGAHNGRPLQEPPYEEVLGRKGRLVRAARDEAQAVSATPTSTLGFWEPHFANATSWSHDFYVYPTTWSDLSSAILISWPSLAQSFPVDPAGLTGPVAQ